MSTRECFRRAREFVRNSEARFTRFSERSELAALNRASGGWAVVTHDLFELVRTARDYVEQTGGLFDPSILDALERAGYDRSMDEIRTAGGSMPVAARERRASDMRGVRFDAARHAIRLPRGLRLDLGGIAKGWIADRTAKLLAAGRSQVVRTAIPASNDAVALQTRSGRVAGETGCLPLTGFLPACAVSAGGDLALRGLPAGETYWEVALEDPRDPDGSLATLRVGPGAVATSSVSSRRWQQGARTMHHLIDPRTQQPAQTDWLSVTVVAPDIITAEVFAKALLIAGSH